MEPKHSDDQDDYQMGFPSDDPPEDGEEETKVEYNRDGGDE